MSETVTQSRSWTDPAASLGLKLGVIWLVMVATPVGVWWAVVTGATDRTAAIAAAGAGIELVGVGFVWLVVVRDVYRLGDLLSAARNGNYDPPAETSRSDVVGRAFDDFAAFRDELADYTDRVEADNRRMNRIATDQAAVMRACADGDLTRRMDADTGVPQLDTVAYRFNGMMHDLEALVATVEQFSGVIVDTGAELRDDVDRGKRASETIEASVGEIDEATDRQSAELDRATAELNDLSTTVESVAARADDLAGAFDRTTARAREGRRAAREAIDGVETIEARIDGSERAVQQLDEITGDVGSLVDEIDDVAARAKFLADQAEVHANRDTDDGRFPRLLAREIGEFAEETQGTVGRIEDRLTEFEAEASDAVAEIEETRAAVGESAETIEAALEEFREITDAIEAANETIGEISRATARQSETAARVVERVEEVSSMSDRTASLADDVAAASTEQVGVLEGTWTGIRRLTDGARALSERLERFETRADAGGGDE